MENFPCGNEGYDPLRYARVPMMGFSCAVNAHCLKWKAPAFPIAELFLLFQSACSLTPFFVRFCFSPTARTTSCCLPTFDRDYRPILGFENFLGTPYATTHLGSTPDLNLYTLNHKTSTRNPESRTQNPGPSTLNHRP